MYRKGNILEEIRYSILKRNLWYWINELKKKYSEISLPVKTVFWFTICAFLQKTFGMLTTPIFTRLMSTEEYGKYSVFMSVKTILSVVATLNITNIIATKGINKYPDREEQFLTNIQFLSSISVLFFTIFFFINQEWICQFTGLNAKIMYFTLGEIFVIPAFEIWSAKQRYSCNYKKILLFTIIYLIFNITIVFGIVVLSQNKGEARIISSCIVSIVMYGVLYLFNICWKKDILNIEMIMFAIKFNLPLIPQGLANQILSRSDILMIQYFQGTSQSGIYSLGYSIASIIVMFTVSINNAYVPWLYKKLDCKKMQDIKEKSIYMLESVFAIVTLVILIAPEIVLLFAPKEYEGAVYVIAPVAVGIAFTIVYTLFVYIELYFEKTMIVMFGSGFIAILNIALNSYFIPRYGFIAAAYTTLLSYIGYVIMHLWAVIKFCGKQINIFEVYNIKKITIMCILQIIILFVAVILYPYRVMRFIFIVIVGLLIGLFITKRRNMYVSRKK